jgi:hypothetical protein
MHNMDTSLLNDDDEEESNTYDNVKTKLTSLLKKNAVKLLVMFAATVLSSSFINYFVSQASINRH